MGMVKHSKFGKKRAVRRNEEPDFSLFFFPVDRKSSSVGK